MSASGKKIIRKAVKIKIWFPFLLRFDAGQLFDLPLFPSSPHAFRSDSSETSPFDLEIPFKKGNWWVGRFQKKKKKRKRLLNSKVHRNAFLTFISGRSRVSEVTWFVGNSTHFKVSRMICKRWFTSSRVNAIPSYSYQTISYADKSGTDFFYLL